MKKEEYKELMLLSIYGELSNEEQSKLDAYLKKHPELKNEFQELKKFKSFVTENTTQKTTNKLLTDARAQLRETLRNEAKGYSVISRIRTMIEELFKPQLVFGGIGILSLGMIIGYWLFAPSGSRLEKNIVVQPVGNSAKTIPQTSIANVRFIDSDGSDGEVEFEFDAIAPMRIKGKLDDPEIQKVLTHALLNETNAGIRLSSVNALRYQIENKKTADPFIKDALISSLKSDVNPGVRSEALRVLQQYEFDNDIRDALLYVISKDNNSGVRIAAINALEIAKMDGTKFDDVTINKLKKQIESEQNNYIRNRAVNLVKEIYQ